MHANVLEPHEGRHSSARAVSFEFFLALFLSFCGGMEGEERFKSEPGSTAWRRTG
jgi:hypothetical protein